MRPNCLFAPCRPALEGGLAEEHPCELNGGKLDFLTFFAVDFFFLLELSGENSAYY